MVSASLQCRTCHSHAPLAAGAKSSASPEGFACAEVLPEGCKQEEVSSLLLATLVSGACSVRLAFDGVPPACCKGFAGASLHWGLLTCRLLAGSCATDQAGHCLFKKTWDSVARE